MAQPYGANFVPGKWCVDQYVWRDEVREAMNLPDSVAVRDVTMREGAEAPGVSLSADEKLRLCERSVALGIRQMDQGFPGGIEEHAEVVRRIKSDYPDVMVSGWIAAWAPNWQEVVDRSLEAGVDMLDTFQHPIHDWGSPEILETWGMDPERIVLQLLEVTDYVVSQGGRISVCVAHFPRTDAAFLRQVFTAAERAGASRILMAEDGTGSPAGVRYAVGMIRSLVDVPIAVHCHNDFGLGTANNLAAVEAGANILDLSINGMGEKAGHSSLEETVVALETFYGLDTGLDLSQLKAYSDLVVELTGVELHPQKPLFGANAFLNGRQSHVRSVLQGLPQAANEAVDPALVGTERRVLITELALTDDTLELRLAQLEVEFDDAGLERLRARIEEILAAQGPVELDRLDREIGEQFGTAGS